VDLAERDRSGAAAQDDRVAVFEEGSWSARDVQWPRNGPSGWYSQRWMARALQSLTSTKPKMWSAASAAAIGVPSAGPGPLMKPSSSSMSRYRSATHHDGAGAAVVANWQVSPVRKQGFAPRAEQPSEVGGVLDRRVEVDEVADVDGS